MNRINDASSGRRWSHSGPSCKSSPPKCASMSSTALANNEGAFVSAYIEVAFPMMPNQDWQNPGYIVGLPLVHIAQVTVAPKDFEQYSAQAHQGQSGDSERRNVAGSLLFLDFRQAADREGRSRSCYKAFLGAAEMVRGHTQRIRISPSSDHAWIEKEAHQAQAMARRHLSVDQLPAETGRCGRKMAMTT